MTLIGLYLCRDVDPQLYGFYHAHKTPGGKGFIGYATIPTPAGGIRGQIVGFLSHLEECPDIPWRIACYAGEIAERIYNKKRTGNLEVFIEIPLENPNRIISIDGKAEIRLLIVERQRVLTGWTEVKEHIENPELLYRVPTLLDELSEKLKDA